MTNTTTTNVTATTMDNDKNNSNTAEECLDFRDIHQHPPAALYTPLPADPSWDAHKVYFNEREKPTRVRGDDFDDVFWHETPEIAFEKQVVEEKKQSDALDPLGWPVVPAAFRTTTTTTQAVTLSLSYDVNDDEDDEEQGDDDDLNLLGRRSDANDDDDDNAVLTTETHGAQSVVGVETAYQAGVVGFRVPAMTKEARIQQYETTGVDEESSVEPDQSDDEDDDEEQVNYLEQAEPPEEEEEGMELPLRAFASFDTECHATSMGQMTAESVATPMAQLVLDDKVVKAMKTKPKSKPNNNKAIPLLRPPPAEKLAAWEKSKAKKR